MEVPIIQQINDRAGGQARLFGGLGPSYPFKDRNQNEFTEFLDGGEPDDSNILLFMMALQLRHLATNEDIDNPGPLDDAPVGGGVLTAAQIRENEFRAIVRDKCLSCKPTALQCLIDLHLCNSVSPLALKSIKSYFTMARSVIPDPQMVKDLLEHAFHILPKSSESPVFVSFRSRNDFVEMHMTASSAGGLCNLILSIIPDSMTHIVTEHDRHVVGLARSHPYSIEAARNIPDRVLALTAKAISIFKIPINRWYMGEKAIMRTPPLLITHYSAMLEAILKVDTVIEKIRRARSEAEVYAAMTNAPDGVVANSHLAKNNRKTSRLNRLNRAGVRSHRRTAVPDEYGVIPAYVPLGLVDIDDASDEEII